MNDEFLREVLDGFSQPQKTLSPKWLYDERGSALFEDITQTEDYYVTAVEASIMETVYDELPARVPPGAAIAEFGSGAGIKSRKLIEALKPSVYVSIDVSEEFLERSCEELREAFPDVSVHGVVADFSGAVDLPPAFFEHDARMGFFPGSTIGNFESGGAQEFLDKSRQSLGPGSRFLVGADLVKDEEVLLAAYDDSEGVTAAFTLNVLERMNRELGTDIDVSTFYHLALWNPEENRLELGAVSKVAQDIEIGGETFHFAEGEMIHTENSHKYTREIFTALAGRAGWEVETVWTDPKEWFGVFLLKA